MVFQLLNDEQESARGRGHGVVGESVLNSMNSKHMGRMRIKTEWPKTSGKTISRNNPEYKITTTKTKPFKHKDFYYIITHNSGILRNLF